MQALILGQHFIFFFLLVTMEGIKHQKREYLSVPTQYLEKYLGIVIGVLKKAYCDARYDSAATPYFIFIRNNGKNLAPQRGCFAA